MTSWHVDKDDRRWHAMQSINAMLYLLKLWILHGIIWQKAIVEHLLHLKCRQINFACCLSRCIGEGGRCAWGAFVVRFYKFSRMLHLHSLVVAKFLMKVDPDKLHTADQRIWRWGSWHHITWRSRVTMKLFVTKCDKLAFLCESDAHLKTRFWCSLMLCDPHMKQQSELAVDRAKLEIVRF